ncbi:hypothetical protein [Myxococcus faecalis]|uniref:hypothetical protein n=1 Tax=Myxococcus faecalis TaxID=3115646 RepID=UPI003CF98ED7
MEATVIIKEPIEVFNELHALGLEEDDLREALLEADRVRSWLTPHHPSYYAGMLPQAETVKALSDRMTTKGWKRIDILNSPRLVSPDGRISIAVNSGDGGTGWADANPRTRSSKGPSTLNDVERNANQLCLPMLIPVSLSPRVVAARTSDRETWFHLFNFRAEEVRHELSLPVMCDEDGHPCAWRTRIIFPPIPLVPDSSSKRRDDGDDFDVPVVRKPM